MIEIKDVRLSFGSQILFKEVNIMFTPGNCYGLIGANGAGKSSFLKMLAGEIECDKGEIIIGRGKRLAMLHQYRQDFDSMTVLDTVFTGHEKLFKIMKDRDALYAKENFSEEDGMAVSHLEAEFAELNGWAAESEAAILLSGLGVHESMHKRTMAELDENIKIRVLLAQALFGNPDILLLDEPTNGLDLASISWLEDFLYKFENTVIVVSHDRHFLNQVCTHIGDIDFQKIMVYTGNYAFWWQASQLAQKQQRDQKKRNDEKIFELREFIMRFSSNAAKSKQATSRKKLIEKLTLGDIPATSRRVPYIDFKPARECGRSILEIDRICKKIGDVEVLNNFSLNVHPGEKIAFVGPQNLCKTTLFRIIMKDQEADSGSFKWGVTITPSWFPRDNTELFDSDMAIVDWLKQWMTNAEESNVRSFLGRMLFSGDEQLKKVSVLSGGERVRCVFAKMMQAEGNVLVMDEPTNHLDLESITALNEALDRFPGIILFNTHDHEFVSSLANRVIEFFPPGSSQTHIDRQTGFEEYLANAEINALRDSMYHAHHALEL
ncbi:MAG: ATP-binding cassette domain-containing protein [Spirochaetaceae bacterium]|nr:MAG: ATP-binding cassette domain-containing protein [Spirochaetaceae bacterium]